LSAIDEGKKFDARFVNFALTLVFGNEVLKRSSLTGEKCRTKKDTVPSEKLDSAQLNIVRGEFSIKIPTPENYHITSLFDLIFCSDLFKDRLIAENRIADYCCSDFNKMLNKKIQNTRRDRWHRTASSAQGNTDEQDNSNVSS
jgi:hypothetical protein